MKTLSLNNLRPAEGSVKKSKRIGRGQGSGKGGTSTRGHKGGQSRSGYKFKAYFEGGQMPISRRIPKFGFNNIHKVEYQIVNIDQLNTLAEKGIKEITPEILKLNGVIKKLEKPIKILGKGELKHAISVTANKFSETAKMAIENSQGKVIEINNENC
ncbi:MAG: 50S ribosomal protein L15 [Candidatus Omnitrophica bacterium]|nr:50S ribosomal protein L15 [Candidatus Omnitrophota bacterium]